MTSKEFSTRLWHLAARLGKIADSLPDHRMARHAAAELLQSAFAAPQSFDSAYRASNRREFLEFLTQSHSDLQRSLTWLRFLPIAQLASQPALEEIESENARCLHLLAHTLHAAGNPNTPPSASPDDSLAPPAFVPLPLHPNLPFTGLDHIAIVVPNTDEALLTWHSRLGFPILFSETVNDNTIRLTHLDLGNTHLQLVEPLTPDHPLQTWLKKNGPSLHHLCLAVDNVGDAHLALPKVKIGVAPKVHQGTRGRRALFLDPASSQGIPLEITGI